jgi:hypothetical protein
MPALVTLLLWMSLQSGTFHSDRVEGDLRDYDTHDRILTLKTSLGLDFFPVHRHVLVYPSLADNPLQPQKHRSTTRVRVYVLQGSHQVIRLDVLSSKNE